MIQSIVEGHGEVEALPVTLRRLQHEAAAHAIQIGTPIRQTRSNLIRQESLQAAVRLALRQPGCRSVLIVFDSDDDCPRELAPQIQTWAQAAAGGVPCRVVMAHREYEAWFLASIESLRGRRGIRDDALAPADPETVRGAKQAIEDRMNSGSSYHEPADQPSLSSAFDMAVAWQRSRSFRRLTKAFGELLHAEGLPGQAWPPAAWTRTGDR